uniref:TolA protein n=1 Tax=Parascaris univalens TaxID=6257 RepID=A0A915B461_PARUN
MSKRLSPEEELEKQYRDYKAQFEQWKEKNRNSVGTEAYIAYVEQFEAWERDVDKRREMIRAKAESDAQEAQAAAQAKAQAAAAAAAAQAAEAKRKKELEVEEQQKKQIEAEAAAQAAAYAQHQQSYLAHHQAAIQKEQQMRQANAASTQDLITDAKLSEETFDASHMAETMKKMAQVAEQVLIGGQQPESFASEGVYQHAASQPAPQPAQQPGPPPQLWGSDRKPYDANDPMFKRWGLRAAPPYFEPAARLPPPDFKPTPCWLMVQQMSEEKLAPVAQVNVPPPPAVAPFPVQQ